MTKPEARQASWVLIWGSVGLTLLTLLLFVI